MKRENCIKKRVCVTDFDGTLISKDSIAFILKKELWFLYPKIAKEICILLWAKNFNQNNILSIRSRLKKLLLKKLDNLPSKKMELYIKSLRESINYNVVNQIKNINYDLIIIESASDKQIIESTMAGILNYKMIISNDRRDISNDFQTCWGENKVKLVTTYLQNPNLYDIDVYTDSFDDLPLMQLGNHTFIVQKNKVTEYDINTD
ncbi:MAG: hypothetical protein P4L35_07945 [Ignavibacteriaceae bacterium]|nr:hypothetical protein [Ignavibacteriaceae bacterium]